jgi:hypothetical protein
MNRKRHYHVEAQLAVVLFCAEYDHKEWCGLEWRAIRDLIKRREGDQIVLTKRPCGIMRRPSRGVCTCDSVRVAGWLGRRPVGKCCVDISAVNTKGYREQRNSARLIRIGCGEVTGVLLTDGYVEAPIGALHQSDDGITAPGRDVVLALLAAALAAGGFGGHRCYLRSIAAVAPRGANYTAYTKEG